MMNNTRRPKGRYPAAARARTCLLTLAALVALCAQAQAQWATSGDNITNTNTGNVGIGTTTPAAKLDVAGSANFSGPTTVAGRGLFSIDGSNNLNLSMFNHFKIHAASINMHGAFEMYDNYFGVRHTPNNTLTVRIPSSGSAYFNQGNVGINITAPVGLFNITGSGNNPFDVSANHTLVNAQQRTLAYGQTRHSVYGAVSVELDNNTANGVYGHVSGSAEGVFQLGSLVGVRGYATAPRYTTADNTVKTYGGHFVGENPHTGGYGNSHYLYGIYARAGSSSTTIPEAEVQYAGFFENSITAGNVAYGIFQATAGARNYFAGNVGIGTTSPAYKLDVNGEINATGFRINGTPIGTGGGSSQWATNGSNINYNSGNVGIGTTSPVSPLHVVSSNANVLVGSISSGYGAIGFQSTLNANNYALTGSAGETVLNTPAGTNLYLRVNNSLTNTLVLNNAGSVGIGTVTPAAKLDVRTPGQANDGFHLAGSDNRFLFLRPSSAAGNHNNLVQSGDTALIYGGNSVGTGSLVIAPWAIGSPSGIKMDALGNVGIGTATPSARLDVNGNINVSGNINAKYQDVAEWVPSSQTLEAGTVVALDPEKSNHVLASSEAYDTRVAGVISAQPGISLGEPGAGKVLVATTGRVKVRVDATRAAIKIGDLLVTSDVAGVAMKSEPVSVGGRRMHSPGTIIGKALEPLQKGTGEILVLLSLQ